MRDEKPKNQFNTESVLPVKSNSQQTRSLGLHTRFILAVAVYYGQRYSVLLREPVTVSVFQSVRQHDKRTATTASVGRRPPYLKLGAANNVGHTAGQTAVVLNNGNIL